MTSVEYKCSLCRSSMKKSGEKEIAGTIYFIYKCEKCNREVAKSSN